MPRNASIVLPDVSVCSVDRFYVLLTLDWVPWIGCTVQFVFQPPLGGAKITVNASLDTANPANNGYYYDTLVTDITVTGRWTMGVHVTNGSIFKRYPYEIGFQVNAQP